MEEDWDYNDTERFRSMCNKFINNINDEDIVIKLCNPKFFKDPSHVESLFYLLGKSDYFDQKFKEQMGLVDITKYKNPEKAFDKIFYEKCPFYYFLYSNLGHGIVTPEFIGKICWEEDYSFIARFFWNEEDISEEEFQNVINIFIIYPLLNDYKAFENLSKVDRLEFAFFVIYYAYRSEIITTDRVNHYIDALTKNFIGNVEFLEYYVINEIDTKNENLEDFGEKINFVINEIDTKNENSEDFDCERIIEEVSLIKFVNIDLLSDSFFVDETPRFYYFLIKILYTFRHLLKDNKDLREILKKHLFDLTRKLDDNLFATTIVGYICQAIIDTKEDHYIEEVLKILVDVACEVLTERDYCKNRYFCDINDADLQEFNFRHIDKEKGEIEYSFKLNKNIKLDGINNFIEAQFHVHCDELKYDDDEFVQFDEIDNTKTIVVNSDEKSTKAALPSAIFCDNFNVIHYLKLANQLPCLKKLIEILPINPNLTSDLAVKLGPYALYYFVISVNKNETNQKVPINDKEANFIVTNELMKNDEKLRSVFIQYLLKNQQNFKSKPFIEIACAMFTYITEEECEKDSTTIENIKEFIVNFEKLEFIGKTYLCDMMSSCSDNNTTKWDELKLIIDKIAEKKDNGIPSFLFNFFEYVFKQENVYYKNRIFLSYYNIIVDNLIANNCNNELSIIFCHTFSEPDYAIFLNKNLDEEKKNNFVKFILGQCNLLDCNLTLNFLQYISPPLQMLMDTMELKLPESFSNVISAENNVATIAYDSYNQFRCINAFLMQLAYNQSFVDFLSRCREDNHSFYPIIKETLHQITHSYCPYLNPSNFYNSLGFDDSSLGEGTIGEKFELFINKVEINELFFYNEIDLNNENSQEKMNLAKIIDNQEIKIKNEKCTIASAVKCSGQPNIVITNDQITFLKQGKKQNIKHKSSLNGAVLQSDDGFISFVKVYNIWIEFKHLDAENSENLNSRIVEESYVIEKISVSGNDSAILFYSRLMKAKSEKNEPTRSLCFNNKFITAVNKADNLCLSFACYISVICQTSNSGDMLNYFNFLRMKELKSVDINFLNAFISAYAGEIINILVRSDNDNVDIVVMILLILAERVSPDSLEILYKCAVQNYKLFLNERNILFLYFANEKLRNDQYNVIKNSINNDMVIKSIAEVKSKNLFDPEDLESVFDKIIGNPYGNFDQILPVGVEHSSAGAPIFSHSFRH